MLATLQALAIGLVITGALSLLPIGGNSGSKAYAGTPAPATLSHPADSVANAHCTPSQNPTVLTSGPNRGKVYCKGPARAAPTPAPTPASVSTITPCGSGDTAYTPSIDIGCRGKGNAIADALFAIIRVLSDGVGLVVVGSVIVGGIQYSASRGDPQATAMAINRIRSSLLALLIFIFAYAFLNYLLPGFALQ